MPLPKYIPLTPEEAARKDAEAAVQHPRISRTHIPFVKKSSERLKLDEEAMKRGEAIRKGDGGGGTEKK